MGRRLGTGVEILTMPQFEYHERPQPKRVVAAVRDMLSDHPIDKSIVEVASFPGRAGEQHVGEELTKVASEPATDRDGEALFPAIQDFARQQLRCRFLENVLLATVLDFQLGGNPCGEIDDLVVEQRHA
jgi:hypothetical protein